MTISSSHRSHQASNIGHEPGVHSVRHGSLLLGMASRGSNGDIGREPGVHLLNDGVHLLGDGSLSLGIARRIHRGRFGSLSLSRASRGRIGHRECNGDIGREPGVHLGRFGSLSLSRASRGRIGLRLLPPTRIRNIQSP
jgi:hypothetical protein